MKNFLRRVFWLCVFVYLGVSLFDLVSIRYHQRKLNIQISKLRVEENSLEKEWQYLLLDKSRMVNKDNYSPKVLQKLDLHEPSRMDTIYLPLPK